MAEEETVKSTIVQLMIEAVDHMTEPLEAAEKSLRGLITDVREVTASFMEFYAVKESLESVIEPAAAMEQQMLDLAQASGQTVEQLEAVKDQAETLSTTYGESTEEVIGATTKMVQIFGNLKDAQAATTDAGQLAVITHMKAAQAANILATATLNLGDKTKPMAEQLQQTGDLLTYLATQTSLASGGVEMLQRDISDATTYSEQLHGTTQQFIALEAVLDNLKIGGRGGPAMAMRELMQLLEQGKKGVSEWSKAGLAIVSPDLGKHIDWVATLTRAHEKQGKLLQNLIEHSGRAGAVMQGLLDHLNDINKKVDDINNKTPGLMGKDAAEHAKLFWVQMASLKNAISNVAEAIGYQLLPDIKWLTATLTDATVAVNKFGKEHPGLVKFIAEVGGLFAAAVGVGAALSLTLATLNMVGNSFVRISELAEGFISPWLLAVILIGVIVVEVYEHWDTIKRIFREGVDTTRYLMEQFFKFFTDPIDTVKTLLHDFHTSFRAFVTDIESVWTGFIGFFAANPILTVIAGALGISMGAKLLRGLWGLVKPFTDLGKAGARGLLAGLDAVTPFLAENPEVAGILAIATSIGILTLALLGNKNAVKDWENALTNNVVVRLFKTAIIDPIIADINRAEAAWNAFLDALANPKLIGHSNLANFVERHIIEPMENFMHFGSNANTGPQPGYTGPQVPTPRLFNPSAYITGAGSGAGNVNYSQVVNLTVTSNGSLDDVKKAVTEAMTEQQDQFARLMEVHMNNETRKTYNELSYAT